MNLVKKLDTLVDEWFTAPEENAAGRMGLFRILYATFYLWHTSSQFAASMAGFPISHERRVFLVALFPANLPTGFFTLVESVLVAALVLLVAGFRVRLVTAAVLISGSLLEAFYTRADPEYATLFLAFYIPLFMLLCNTRWGATYSLDALLLRRAGKPRFEPSNSSGAFFIPARAALVMLGLLFLSAAALKMASGGTWLDQPRFMANLMLADNVKASIHGTPLNALAPLISESPVVYRWLLYQTIVFEALFFLTLFNRGVRNLFIAVALVFHAVGAIWLSVTFTPILVVYGLYVDRQKLRERIWSNRVHVLAAAPTGVLVATAICAAVGAGALWNHGNALRSVVNMNAWLNWHTVWYPVLPIVSVWLILTGKDAVRRAGAEKRIAS